MSLKVTLTIDKRELLFQEDATLEIGILNQGTAPVTTLSPANSYALPILIATDTATGARREFRREPSLFVREMPIALPPGRSETGRLSLLSLARFEQPGTYDLVARWEWNDGAGRADSDPVRLTIRQVQPQQVDWISVVGGPSTAHVGAWVDLAVQPPVLALSWLDLGRKPRVARTRVLGPIAPGARPVVSTPAVGELAPALWLAWFEGDRLQIARTTEEEDGPPGLTNRLDLSPVPKAIVPPLNCMSGPRGPEGKFFLWQGNPEGTISRFQTVHLDARGDAEAGANALLAGARPVWMQACFLSGRVSRTYALTQDGPTLTLQGVRWGADDKAERAQPLASWPGQFLAAAATLAADDTVYGAVLALEPGPPDLRRLLLHGWAHRPSGEFERGPTLDLERTPDLTVQRAVVGAGIRGEPVALILVEGGMWESFREATGRKGVMDPKVLGQGPVNILFPNSTDPLIQYCDPGRGFYFLKFDGTPAGPPVSG